MHIAAPFALDNASNNERIDEFNIIFKEDSSMEKLVEFLELYQEKRINIYFERYKPTQYELKLLNASNDNFYVALSPGSVDAEELKNLGVKFFSCRLISSWTELVNWTGVGVTDIYPAGDLLYDMDALRGYCDKHSLNIRYTLNAIPSLMGEPEDVFFRPQEFELLDKYFDTVEFICDGDPFDARHYNWNMFRVLYKAWFVKHKWVGDLAEINVDIDYSVPCEMFPSRFFEKKLNCNYGCKKGRSCNSCSLYYNMALNIREKGLRIAT